MFSAISAISASLRSRPAAARAARLAIIGAAVLVFAGCSALRLGYNNAAQLSWWWADNYVDFSRDQAPAVRQAFDNYFDWHRSTQLPELAGLLAQLQPALAQPLTPEAACGWFEQARRKLDPSIDRALVQTAELLPQLTENNLRRLEQRNAKSLQELRKQHLQASPEERRERALKRARESAERLYGKLGPAQLQVLAASLEASPFDPALWLAERERRQADTVQTLRQLLSEQAEPERRVQALRALALRSQQSPDPAYRAYQQQLTQYNCGLVSSLHNATTPAQRQRAQQTLLGWEGDLRALAASGVQRPATAGLGPGLGSTSR